jgi:DNA helicase II / ATP-dependent DNA helicase PcrA
MVSSVARISLVIIKCSIVGKINDTYQKVKILCNDEEINSLSRDNITSNAMKMETELGIPKKDLFPILYNTDSNSERRKLMIACIKAIELARESKFKEAIKELEEVFRDKDDKEKGKKEALKHIQALLKNYNNFKNSSLHRLYEIVKSEIKTDISNLVKGKAKEFYEHHLYQELAVCVKIVEDKSFHKTIHKAKGDEFDNVLLILKNESDLEFLIKPNLTDDEEHRINYVAVSRAKKRLFISVPSLSEQNKTILETQVIVDLT